MLTVVASRDTICPAEAATAMNDLVSSEDQSVLTIGGGHVGAVVGSRAPKQLYPAVAEWLIERFGKDAAPSLREVDAEELEPMEARTLELEAMTVAQLRRVLRQHDIVTSGNKAELVARVIAHEFDLSGEEE